MMVLVDFRGKLLNEGYMQSDFLRFPFVRLQFFNFIDHVWLNRFARVNCFAHNYNTIILIFCCKESDDLLDGLPDDLPLSHFLLSLLTVMFAAFSKCKVFSYIYAARLSNSLATTRRYLMYFSLFLYFTTSSSI